MDGETGEAKGRKEKVSEGERDEETEEKTEERCVLVTENRMLSDKSESRPLPCFYCSHTHTHSIGRMIGWHHDDEGKTG